jgi:DNA-binding transcriptional LysR family regulator
MPIPPAALPDLDSLRCFLAAADRDTFRAAASDVGLSPAAFSERISRLEDLLGAALFDRAGRGLPLTPAGRRLQPEAQAVLERVERCVIAVDEVDRQAPYDLTLGTRYELGLSWLVPALAPLAVAHPERTLNLYFGQHADLVQRLRAGAVQAVVTSGRLAEEGLAYAPLHAEDYVLVGCPSAAPRLEGPDQAPSFTLLDASPAMPLFRYLLDADDSGAPWAWGRVRSLGTIAAIRHQALAGVGVAVLPRYFVQPDLDAGRLERLLPEAPLRADAFRLVWRAGDASAGALRDLARELRALPLR